MRRLLPLVLAWAACFVPSASAAAQPTEPVAVSVELTGTIDPATSTWVSDALEDAAECRAAV